MATTKLQYLESFYWFTFHNDLTHIESDFTKLIMFDSITNQNINQKIFQNQTTFDGAINALFPKEAMAQ